MIENLLWRSRVGSALAAIIISSLPFASFSQTANVTVNSSADAFVRSEDPTLNYGAAGALSVSGSAATNAAGAQNGLFDTLVRFPTAAAAATMNSIYGSNLWKVTGVSLGLSEVGAPNDVNFNRGVGGFEIRWIAADFWLEGTGRPSFPTSDGVTYQDLPTVLNPAIDVSLGRFTNSGTSTPLSFALPAVGVLVSNITAGSEINLYLTAAAPSVGFTFNSHNYSVPGDWPVLRIAVAGAPTPVIDSISRTNLIGIALRFTTASNWTYQVQRATALPAADNGGWFTLATYPSRGTNAQQVFTEPATGAESYYRLAVSP